MIALSTIGRGAVEFAATAVADFRYELQDRKEQFRSNIRTADHGEFLLEKRADLIMLRLQEFLGDTLTATVGHVREMY
jgi:hypothetical protein